MRIIIIVIGNFAIGSKHKLQAQNEKTTRIDNAVLRIFKHRYILIFILKKSIQKKTNFPYLFIDLNLKSEVITYFNSMIIPHSPAG